MSKTEEHLKEAFAGESQANRKYLAFAKKADEEGSSPDRETFPGCSACRDDSCHESLKGDGWN